MHIVAIGSSIFEQWTSMQQAFVGHTLSNLAIGGTQTTYWREAIDTIIITKPANAYAYYCGSNDFNNAVKPEEIIANSLHIAHRLSAAGSLFIYYPIIKAPQKAGSYQAIDEVNQAISQGLPAEAHVVDFNNFLCPDKAAVDGLYRGDQLHLTEDAYQLMAEANKTALPFLQP